MSFHKVRVVLGFFIEYFSRKHIAKLLLKLPSIFFPNYRIVVGPVITDTNRCIRRKTILHTSNSDDSYEGDFQCNNCRNMYLKRKSENWQSVKHFETDDNEESENENSPNDNKLDIKKNIFERNLFATPPLRKITAKELSSVKLRKSVNFPLSPPTPEIHDFAGILRKRFVVMHSPNMLSEYPEAHEEDSDISI